MTLRIVFIFILAVFTQIHCSTSDTTKSSGKIESVKTSRTGTAYLGILYVKARDGVRVVEVFPGSPAEKIGLKLGDLILTTDGYPVIGTFTLRERILSLEPGDTISLEVEKRDGRRTLKKAVLGVLPEGFSNPDE